jgi:hypothetical protein
LGLQPAQQQALLVIAQVISSGRMDPSNTLSRRSCNASTSTIGE